MNLYINGVEIGVFDLPVERVSIGSIPNIPVQETITIVEKDTGKKLWSGTERQFELEFGYIP